MSRRNLLGYWLTLYEKRWWVLLITLASAGSGFLLSYVFEPVYQSSTTFYLPADTRQPAYFSAMPDAFVAKQVLPARDEDEARPYIGMLKSRTLAEAVHADYPTKKVTKLMHCDIDAEFTDEFMIRIYSRDRDPEVAAGVANSYVRHLDDMVSEFAVQTLGPQRERLLASTSNTAARAEAAEQALKDFEEQHALAAIEHESQSLTAAKTDFISKLEEARVSAAQAAQRRTALQARLAEEKTALAGGAPILDTPVTTKLRDRLTDLATQLSAKQVELGDSNLDIQVARAEYKQVRAELENELTKLIAAPVKSQDTQYEALRRQLAQAMVDESSFAASRQGYEEALTRLDQRLTQFPALQAQHNRLAGEVARLRTLSESLAKDLEEVELQLSRKGNTLVLVDAAVPSTHPSFPMFWLNGIFGLLAGLPLGIAFAFVIDYAETSRHATLRKLVRALRAEGA
jgi:uncharacterized protein involved in exopolysaccharide biosynthesis